MKNNQIINQIKINQKQINKLDKYQIKILPIISIIVGILLMILALSTGGISFKVIHNHIIISYSIIVAEFVFLLFIISALIFCIGGIGNAHVNMFKFDFNKCIHEVKQMPNLKTKIKNEKKEQQSNEKLTYSEFRSKNQKYQKLVNRCKKYQHDIKVGLGKQVHWYNYL